ncbi:hypothetical protein KU43P_22750 [Pseudomonas sp. KU43P]|nr:hypothetical protein KU43P_22750 [Pseudomonas sp. KU43P]
MIDSATGMKRGERYCVENLERAHQFPGFFQDGKYYLGPELLTAVGWLEGNRFIYDSLDAQGEPVFPERVAGTIEGLALKLVDGTSLQLSRMEASAPFEPQRVASAVTRLAQSPPIPSTSRQPVGWQRLNNSAVILVAAAALGFVAGFLITGVRRKHH